MTKQIKKKKKLEAKHDEENATNLMIIINYDNINDDDSNNDNNNNDYKNNTRQDAT